MGMTPTHGRWAFIKQGLMGIITCILVSRRLRTGFWQGLHVVYFPSLALFDFSEGPRYSSPANEFAEVLPGNFRSA